jgi:hypothetical protein
MYVHMMASTSAAEDGFAPKVSEVAKEYIAKELCK